MIDPMTGLVKAASKLPTVTAIPFWWKTGASFKSLEDAARAGMEGNPVFMNHLRGVSTAEDMINSVDDAVRTISKNASDKYVQSMGKMSEGPLSFDKIDDAYNKAYGEARSLDKVKDLSMAQGIELCCRTCECVHLGVYDSAQPADQPLPAVSRDRGDR